MGPKSKIVKMDYVLAWTHALKVPPILLDAIITMYRYKSSQQLASHRAQSFHTRTSVFHQFSAVTGEVAVDTLLNVSSLVRSDVLL